MNHEQSGDSSRESIGGGAAIAIGAAADRRFSNEGKDHFATAIAAPVGLGAGAAIGAANDPSNDRLASAVSGAFAGLFTGALFAAFFHSLCLAFF